MSNRKKYRGINEIKVKLLPDFNKRDYILRLVSSMIILLFVIINVIINFIPAINLTMRVNEYNRSIYSLEAQYNNVIERIQQFDRDYLKINKNKEVLVIESRNIDYRKIFEDISSPNIIPDHSFIEDVKYSAETDEMLVYIQFDKLIDLTNYKSDLQKISYVISVTSENPRDIAVPDGQPRVATYFKIKFDSKISPRVGDMND